MYYISQIQSIYYSIQWHAVISWLADGQHKSHTKNCLEFENNAVSHTTFSAWPACWLGPN